jgi:hypothetical protein
MFQNQYILDFSSASQTLRFSSLQLSLLLSIQGINISQCILDTSAPALICEKKIKMAMKILRSYPFKEIAGLAKFCMSTCSFVQTVTR